MNKKLFYSIIANKYQKLAATIPQNHSTPSKPPISPTLFPRNQDTTTRSGQYWWSASLDLRGKSALSRPKRMEPEGDGKNQLFIVRF